MIKYDSIWKHSINWGALYEYKFFFSTCFSYSVCTISIMHKNHYLHFFAVNHYPKCKLATWSPSTISSTALFKLNYILGGGVPCVVFFRPVCQARWRGPHVRLNSVPGLSCAPRAHPPPLSSLLPQCLTCCPSCLFSNPGFSPGCSWELRTVLFPKLRDSGPLCSQSRSPSICGWRSEVKDLEPAASADPAAKGTSRNSWHQGRFHRTFGSFVSLCSFTFKALQSSSFPQVRVWYFHSA